MIQESGQHEVTAETFGRLELFQRRWFQEGKNPTQEELDRANAILHATGTEIDALTRVQRAVLDRAVNGTARLGNPTTSKMRIHG